MLIKFGHQLGQLKKILLIMAIENWQPNVFKNLIIGSMAIIN
jgi:hypothetical protein